MMKKFNLLILNGPNLNLLSLREKNIYGNKSISDLLNEINLISNKINARITHFQSNAEHEIINCIHKSYKKINFIILNPSALTHTSVALRDSLLSVNIPFIEVHLSNIFSREKFRHRSYISDIAIGMICGLGVNGYYFAIKAAMKYLVKI
ncbi:type II 3-dehydroquinate dehydratase [Wigglesworthia glossinidia]|nr:type II 3-dehydroquinate dehydratase [Wigglesworthia glossinidia]